MGSIEDISIITRDKGYPKGQSSSGKNLKFIPYILATSVGGRNMTLTMVNILMILFCSIPS
jgi:hypothetical protein